MDSDAGVPSNDGPHGDGRPDQRERDGVDVSIEVVVDDGHNCPGCRTLLRLAWRREDPLAVHLQLTPQPDHPALLRGGWVVLRETVQAGLTGPAGDGDVRLEPASGRLRIVLQRSARPATIAVPRRIVEAFLYETEQIVPTGSERPDVALDQEIDRLMRS